MAKVIGALILFILGVATLVVLWSSAPTGVVARLAKAILQSGWRKIPVFQTQIATSTTPTIIQKSPTKPASSKQKTPSSQPQPKPPVVLPQAKLHDVRVSSVSTSSSGDRTTVVLRNASELPWSVTGWTLKSKVDQFTLPLGISDFLVGLGGIPQVPMILKKGDRLNIYTEKSATVGAFRVNKCFGYITRVTNFSPSISASCPSIIPTNIADYTSRCQDYLRQINSCTQPRVDPPISLTDYECREYLKTINYAGCVDAHRFDKDFLGSDWHLWIGDSSGAPRRLVDPAHDKVQLWSDKGVLIDEYIY